MNNIFKLNNGIKVVFKKNVNTPRITVNFFLKNGIIREKFAGQTSLITKLLLQGTSNYNAQELAEKIDFYAIDMMSDTKQDYMKVSATFLNKDLQTALSLMSDIVLNSTFENFDKEVTKLKGEIQSDLDSAKTKAFDNLIKHLYINHPYGNTHSRVLEDIDKITKDDVKNLYYSNLSADKVVISVVGDTDENTLKAILEKNFGSLENKQTEPEFNVIPKVEKPLTVTISKDDAAQAQVVQAWIIPDIKTEDAVIFMVMNAILGSGGLSTRLFLELREKKGLAYVVRSSLDLMNLASTFSFYIATEPKNIKTAIEGFKTEVEKIKTEYVSDEELIGAKNNIFGKRAFLHETNSQQSHYIGYYELFGLGANYDTEIEEKIKNVTKEDIKRIANKYLTENIVTSILAPKQYLENL